MYCNTLNCCRRRRGGRRGRMERSRDGGRRRGTADLSSSPNLLSCFELCPPTSRAVACYLPSPAARPIARAPGSPDPPSDSPPLAVLPHGPFVSGRHAILVIVSHLNGEGLGSDEVSSGGKFGSANADFEPPLAILTAKTVLILELNSVGPGREALLHRLGLIGTHLLHTRHDSLA